MAADTSQVAAGIMNKTSTRSPTALYLRACPKCGGAVVVEEDRCALGQIWMVRCLNCGRHRDLNWQPNPTVSRQARLVGGGLKNKKGGRPAGVVLAPAGLEQAEKRRRVNRQIPRYLRS